jgi:SAM-dependent methyltransferase
VDERLAAQLQLMALSDDDFVSCVFLRTPDQEARASALDALRGHALSRAGLVANLVASEEFTRLRALDDGIVRGAAARATGERPHELSAPADVGADNTRYGAAPDHYPTGPIAALHELRRVVARGGRILVTVPYGERRQENWYVHHTATEWRDLFDAADLDVYDGEEYSDHDVLCAELHPGRRRHELVHLIRRRKRRRRDSNPRWRHSPP